MMPLAPRSVLVDARDLTVAGLTGIGRVVIGLADALARSDQIHRVDLAVGDAASVSESLTASPKISVRPLPAGRIAAEWALTRWSGNVAVFISPYPKLPSVGVRATAVHIVHDVLDMTMPPYCHRFRNRFDRWRLDRALARADLTWYDSEASLDETRHLAGHVGRKPRVRYPGIDSIFSPTPMSDDAQRQRHYGLDPGYLLVVGNGRPHKNIGVAMDVAETLGFRIAIAGAGPDARKYWEQRAMCRTAHWIGHVADADLPALYRGALCLLQPSLAEGYGYPPLEAMASGIPVVVSRIGVLTETTGGHATACDPHRVDAWCDAVTQFGDPDCRAASIAAGRQWSLGFQGVSGWQGHVSDIEDILNQGEGI